MTMVVHVLRRLLYIAFLVARYCALHCYVVIQCMLSCTVG